MATKYDFDQLQSLWIQAGGAAAWAPTMAAVALGAESGGDPTIVNSIGATGLWQILISAHPQYTTAQMQNPLENAKAAVALLGNGSGISNWGKGTGDAIGTAVQANGDKPLTTQQALQYVNNPPSTNATFTADVTTAAPTQTFGPHTPIVPATSTSNSAPAFAAPIAGADITNFHGFDLSAFLNPDGSPTNNLGNAEQAILQYVANPNAVDKNGLTLMQRVASDFNYTTSYIDELPADQQSQVKAALIWGAQYSDGSDAASKAQFQSVISNTDWYKSTTQFQRAWQNIQGTDPATANEYLTVAEEKVRGVANQIGVQLTQAQLMNIANMYASQTFTPTGTYSAMSGTSPEWLDAAVVSAVTNAGQGGPGSDLTQQGGGAAGGNGSLTGIAATLYDQFLNAAQEYLMYNPGDPTQSLMSSQSIMDQVNSALQDYTGTGASGQISQFEAGALSDFVDNVLKPKASQMYPSLAPSIAQGITPQNYTAPEQTTIANTLGIDASSIDFTNPQWSWVIATPDPKTGVKTAQTPDQILQKITSPNFTWTNPDGSAMTYNDTNNAKQTAQTMITNLSGMFGVGGT